MQVDVNNQASPTWQAMVLAAGLGTRLRPLTDTMPKALVEVGGKPMLERVMTRLKAAGASRVVVNVHHFASRVREFLATKSNFGMDVLVSDESDCLLDTGGGLRKAAPLFLEGVPILVHNVDVLSDADLGALVAGHGDNDATLLVSDRQTSRYLLFGGDMRLVGWTNVLTGEVRSPHPGLDPGACRRLAFSGIHVVSTGLLGRMAAWPGVFGIMDFYLGECAGAAIRGLEMPGLRLLDMGKRSTLAQAEAFLGECRESPGPGR